MRPHMQSALLTAVAVVSMSCGFAVAQTSEAVSDPAELRVALLRPRFIPGSRGYARHYGQYGWYRSGYGHSAAPRHSMPAPGPAEDTAQKARRLPAPADTARGDDAPVRGPAGDSAPEAKPGAEESKVAPPSALPSLLLAPPDSPGAPAPYATRLNLNTARLDQIQSLPGVGPSMGAHILAGRPYRTIGELARDGVPLDVIEKIAPLITLEP